MASSAVDCLVLYGASSYQAKMKHVKISDLAGAKMKSALCELLSIEILL